MAQRHPRAHDGDMDLILRLNLIAIPGGVVMTAFLLWVTKGVAPDWRWALALAHSIFFYSWWTLRVARVRFGGAEARRPASIVSAFWHHEMVRVFWAGNAQTVALIILIMPYTSEAVSLYGALFATGPVMIEAMMSVRPPQFGKRGWALELAPYPIALAIIGFELNRQGQYSAGIIAVYILSAAILILLRAVLQDNQNEIHVALMQVQAERDAKARFLASASHDLGQPLQSARLFFDQAVRGADPAKRAKAVVQAEAAFASIGRQLHQMIDHLRLESGDVVAQISTLPIGLLIARVASLADAAAAQAGVVIHAMPSRLLVLADSDLLERALSNLADNAIRHAKARRLLIGARRHGDKVRVWVIDDGAGIPPADGPRLFEDFVQGSDHGDEVRGGFGLGLSSVQRMAGLMGGMAGLDTDWKQGAAFFVELPIARP